MLQINPEVTLERAHLRATAPKVWAGFLAFTAAVILVQSYQAQTFVFSPILLIPFITLAAVYAKRIFDVYWYSRKSYLQRIERVLLGDTSFLAIDQPIPDKHTLPPYIFISWRTRISACILAYFLGWLFMLALCMPFIILLLPSSFALGLLLRFGIAFVGVPVMVVFYVMWLRRKTTRKAQEQQEEAEEEDESAPKDIFSMLTEQFVNVDEESLTLYAFGKGYIDIPWEEARLFCIVSGGSGPKSQRTYALVSENASVKWVDAPSQSFWPLRRYRPWLLDAQHQQETQKLLQFIAAQTGLPLYDLREKRVI